MRRWEPDTASRVLMQRLTDQGLPAYTYVRDGHPCVHVAPELVPAAGTDITVIPGEDACRYMSEWGAVMGDTRSIAQVVDYILMLFGRRSTQP